MSTSTADLGVVGRVRWRIRDLVVNPWGKPRFLWVVGLGYVAWTLVPIVLAVLFSFNPGRSISSFQGFSLRWYFGDPSGSVWHDPELRRAVWQSLKLATGTVLITVPLGVAFAVGMDRWKGRGSGTTDFVMMFSFVAPELIIAVALFLLFVNIFKFVGLGTPAQLAGMVVLSMAFVVVVVRARLLSLGRGYEEAAMDLGASPVQAVRRVLLPLLLPATLASAAMLFVFTLDDFVLANALSLDVSTEPISVKIWAARGGPTPVVNALGSLMLFISTIVIVLALVLYRRLTRGEHAATKRVGLPIA
jgi:spermidine/putrescine transport system permease protein